MFYKLLPPHGMGRASGLLPSKHTQEFQNYSQLKIILNTTKTVHQGSAQVARTYKQFLGALQ